MQPIDLHETRDDPYPEELTIDKRVGSDGNPNLKRKEASFHLSSPTYSPAGFNIADVAYCRFFSPGKCLNKERVGR